MGKKKKIGKWTVEVHKMEGLYPYVRLEDFMKVCKCLEEENETLKDNVEFLHSCLDDRDESIAILQEENKKLGEEIDKITKDRDERKRKEECSNVIIDFVKQQAREKGWTI